MGINCVHFKLSKSGALYAVTSRKFALKPKSGSEDDGVFPNLYLNVIPDTLHKVWVADLTYIRRDDDFA
jgi:hypothetical protein